MVVNDLKVPNGLALGRPSEVHVQPGLAGSLGQHGEVRGLSNFHTWKPPETRVRAGNPQPATPARTSSTLAQTPTCAAQPRALSLDLASIVGGVHLDVEGTGRDLLDMEQAWSGFPGHSTVVFPRHSWSGARRGQALKAPPAWLRPALHSVCGVSDSQPCSMRARVARTPGGPQYLVGEQHHDGIVAGPWGRVLDCEGVVVVLDDVEVDVGFHRPHHARRALDANAHIT